MGAVRAGRERALLSPPFPASSRSIILWNKQSGSSPPQFTPIPEIPETVPNRLVHSEKYSQNSRNCPILLLRLQENGRFLRSCLPDTSPLICLIDLPLLLVAQRLDRVEVGGFICRVSSKHHSHQRANQERQEGPVQREGGRDF